LTVLQSFYQENFDREMGCTAVEWLMWLPAAMGDVPWARQGDAVQASIPTVPNSALHIAWSIGEPRRIALFNLPRLHVAFSFSGLDAEQRYTFMKRFDLYMQRGGG
jgi:hypothetical protein